MSSPCGGGFAETLCDLSTLAINACVDSCQDTLTMHQGGANDDATACQSDCDEADTSGFGGCSSTAGDCSTACDTGRTGCLDGCGANLADCFLACSSGDPSGFEACEETCTNGADDCEAGCETTNGDCHHSCDSELCACEQPILGTSLSCNEDCADNERAALNLAQDEFLQCTRECCSEKPEHPFRCHTECERTAETCLATAIDSIDSCQRACDAFLVALHCPTGTSADDAAEKGYQDCVLECDAGAIFDQVECGDDHANCDRDCTLDDMKDQEWCDYYENRCFGQCETAYLSATLECRQTQLHSNATCTETEFNCEYDCGTTHDGCLEGCGDPFDPSYESCAAACEIARNACIGTYEARGGGCLGEQFDCLDEALTAELNCLQTPTGARYDCRFACCTNTAGGDVVASCYKDCWHSAGCADTSTSCEDALAECLFRCPGVYGDEAPILPTCNTCGFLASQPFAFL